MITPLGHRTVEEALVKQLRDAIVTGSLTPGDRLVYRDLARRFGVSVTPVRIALRELSKEGLVEMRAHAGARVSLAVARRAGGDLRDSASASKAGCPGSAPRS